LYQEEAWVDASSLLKQLSSFLMQHKVEWISDVVSNALLAKLKPNFCVLCTGAWTIATLESLNISVPDVLKKSQRVTMGSTIQGVFAHILPNDPLFDFVLYEKVSLYRKQKVTFTLGECFSKTQHYLSSSSLKINIEDILQHEIKNKDTYFKNLEHENQKLLELFSHSSFASLENVNTFRYFSGLRIGFGHSELVVHPFSFEHGSAVVCAGAHKSGFLWAPVVGELVFQHYLNTIPPL
jgi:hypothetical protein